MSYYKKLFTDALRAKAAAHHLSVSDRTFYRLNKLEGFPKPYRFNKRCVVYLESELNAWLEEQRGARS